MPTQREEAIVLEGASIRFYQLLVWQQAIRLELLGMHRRGTPVTQIVREQLGFKGSRAQVLEQLTRHIESKRSAEVS